jgi:rhodanese-related sulfurtransferase
MTPTVPIAEMTPEEVEPRLADLHVIDVRADHEYHGPLGRVKGARLAPLPELEARAGTLPDGRPLLLVCRSGVRSGKGCEQLEALGIGPVVNLAGGMIAWNRAGLPVEQTEPASLRGLLDQIVAWTAQVRARDREAVRQELREGLGRIQPGEGQLDDPTHSSVSRILELLEEWFREADAPPDLEPSLTSFRRWLGAL